MSGRFVERVHYNPYDQPELVLAAHPFDYDDDGNVAAADIAAATTGGDCWRDYTGQAGDCKRLDADRGIEAADHTAMSNYVNELPTAAVATPACSADSSKQLSAPKPSPPRSWSPQLARDAVRKIGRYLS